MSAVKIVIVDDHPLFRGALSQALSASFTDADIGEAGSLDELTQRLETDKDVDLVLLDLSMPGVQGLSGLLFLRAQHPEIPGSRRLRQRGPHDHSPLHRVRRLKLRLQSGAC